MSIEKVTELEEPLPENEMRLAQSASETCDFFLSVGTSALVYPAASLPFEALRNGATVVEINPQPTALTAQAHYALPFAAGTVLPELLANIRALRA